MKVVINACHGGFRLSEEALKELGLEWSSSECAFDAPEKRSDKRLVAVVSKLGEKANGAFASLKIVEIPDGVKWHIEDYDGAESVREDHRAWS